MPDVHWGMGATVGSVIAMKDAVSPAAVGVDIGCGMAAVRMDLSASDLPDSLADLRHEIERSIPVGFHWNKKISSEVLGSSLWGTVNELQPITAQLFERAMLQMGTLGGGNHFIELCLDENDAVWFMLHSGSRHIGKTLADYHISIAKTLAHNDGLPDPDLSVFLAGTPEMAAYRNDLYWAQEYALQNRQYMIRILSGVMLRAFPQLSMAGDESTDHLAFDEPVMCHHNYVAEETHYGEKVFLTRKGAISADKGELGIIPGSMGTKSFIVKGLGCEESFRSASHGAGRRMSRNKAKKTFTVDDFAAQTDGVECRKDKDVLDEIPGAYKDIDKVMGYQADLVKIEHELRPVLCVKG
ncbi:hypothetical protein LCGC14_0334960 [marine sediment metagenome]|uniref:3'-phosphate/5'-hydroxy nucleic acid ligase n=1 Tax=marine sediment metagenome TaxID=412755 RepID=A0A0F9WMX7_9ZZZZ